MKYKLEDHECGVELDIVGFRALVMEFESATDEDLIDLANLQVGVDSFYHYGVLVIRTE